MEVICYVTERSDVRGRLSFEAASRDDGTALALVWFRGACKIILWFAFTPARSILTLYVQSSFDTEFHIYTTATALRAWRQPKL